MTGYPQRGFNPYSMYQNWGYGYQYPAFRGVQNVPQPVSVPQPNVNLQTPPDTVSFKATEHIQTKPKKEGLSTGAKWGLGALALAGIGTAVYFATRGKVGAKQAQQLAEHIEFKPAKTAEEAKKFAQEKLGVHYQDIDDVNVVNYINEWLTTTYNKAKGKISTETYPKIIANSHNVDGYCSTFYMSDEVVRKAGIKGHELGVNIDAFKHFDKFLDEVFETSHKNISADIFGPKKDFPFVKDFISRVKKFDNKKATFDEKIKLYQDIYRIREGRIVGEQFIPANISKHRDLWHELGHLRHRICSSNYGQMKSAEEFIEQKIPVSQITKEFLENKATQETANKVSWYACESPLEFVAEVFAGHNEGLKFSDDVMALYKKYGGPALT